MMSSDEKKVLLLIISKLYIFMVVIFICFLKKNLGRELYLVFCNIMGKNLVFFSTLFFCVKGGRCVFSDGFYRKIFGSL